MSYPKYELPLDRLERLTDDAVSDKDWILAELYQDIYEALLPYPDYAREQALSALHRATPWGAVDS